MAVGEGEDVAVSMSDGSGVPPLGLAPVEHPACVPVTNEIVEKDNSVCVMFEFGAPPEDCAAIGGKAIHSVRDAVRAQFVYWCDGAAEDLCCLEIWEQCSASECFEVDVARGLFGIETKARYFLYPAVGSSIGFGQMFVVLVAVHHPCDAEGFDVVEADSSFSLFSGAVQGRQ